MPAAWATRSKLICSPRASSSRSASPARFRASSRLRCAAARSPSACSGGIVLPCVLGEPVAAERLEPVDDPDQVELDRLVHLHEPIVPAGRCDQLAGALVLLAVERQELRGG